MKVLWGPVTAEVDANMLGLLGFNLDLLAGLALPFLTSWLAGDVTNLVG
jgi:hypothetical protein